MSYRSLYESIAMDSELMNSMPIVHCDLLEPDGCANITSKLAPAVAKESIV